jgi:hypothetical protein
MNVVAMMTCEGKRDDKQNEGTGDVSLRAVTGQDEHYKEFFQWTPYGTCTLGILNQSAYAQFEPGATYRVTFEKV